MKYFAVEFVVRIPVAAGCEADAKGIAETKSDLGRLILDAGGRVGQACELPLQQAIEEFDEDTRPWAAADLDDDTFAERSE